MAHYGIDRAFALVFTFGPQHHRGRRLPRAALGASGHMQVRAVGHLRRQLQRQGLRGTQGLDAARRAGTGGYAQARVMGVGDLVSGVVQPCS
ncbi:MAG: hypothetical protein J0H24_17745, partial [Delftia acidovorans]|nr:hypothetical protein [Delftia acidovorans]